MLYIVEDSEKFELRIDKYSFNELLFHQEINPSSSKKAPALNPSYGNVESDVT